MITVNPTQATTLLLKTLKAGKVPLLVGSPGIGKSDIINNIAKANNLKVIDLRLSQMDPVDLVGLPYFNADHTKSDFIPPAYFPLEGDPLPEGKNGWLCHHKDTEVLTKTRGFVLFNQLTNNDEVAQYDMATKEISYAIPEGYLSYRKKGKLVSLYNQKTSAGFCITEDHDLIIQTKPTKRSTNLLAYKRKPLETPISGDLIIPMAGMHNEGRSYLTAWEKLAIAFQADGNIKWKGDGIHSLSFGFNKKRKIEAFRALLAELPEIKYTETQGRLTYFYLKQIKDKYCQKDLSHLFTPSDFNTQGCQAFLDYITKWDGFIISDHSNGYSNTNKRSCDVVQEMCLLANYRSNLMEIPDNRSDTFKTCYKVHWKTNQSYVTTQVLKHQKLIDYNDVVYCLKMPKTTLITRYKGRVLISGNCFFDEITSCSPSIQAASYKILLDRMIGQQKIHPKVAMIAAGNKATDKAITHRMSTALQARLIHFELSVNSNQWLDWAATAGIDYRIMAYIGFKPTSLHMFEPAHNDCTYSCPRTWTFLSDLIKKEPILNHEILPLLTGTIGEASGREFNAYCQIFDQLPNFKDIEAKPTTIDMPSEPSILFAITSMIVYQITKDNIDVLMLFVTRLPIEFQIIMLRQALKSNMALLQAKSIKDWIAANNKLLVDI